MARKTFHDILTRHQVYLERLKSALVLNFDQEISGLADAIAEVLSKVEDKRLNTLSKARLSELLQDLQETQGALQMQSLFKLSEQLNLVAGAEAKFMTSTLAAAVEAAKTRQKLTAPNATKAYSRALEQPVVDGQLLQDFMTNWSDKQIERVQGAVRDGWAQGKTVQEVMQQIRGTRAANYKDGIVTMSRRDAASVVRTSTQHVANQARMETYAQNDDVVLGYAIVATLDSATTQICRSLDGQVFELGKGPVPPLHVGCRSATEPKLGPEFDFLDEGATRSSENGYVDGNQTYYDWLKQQPRDFVGDAIGRDRAKLFLDGGLSSQEFADLNLGKNFEPMTLKEMAEANPRVFESTGLERYLPKQ